MQHQTCSLELCYFKVIWGGGEHCLLAMRQDNSVSRHPKFHSKPNQVFSLHYQVQTCSGAHLAYSMDIQGSVPGSKVAGA
jgi:hypothetical protein